MEGSTRLTKTGAGTISLSDASGWGFNTHTGGVVVDAGKLNVLTGPDTAEDSLLGASGVPITVNADATLQFSGERSAGYHSGIVAINSGTILIDGNDISLGSGNSTFITGTGSITSSSGNTTGLYRFRDGATMTVGSVSTDPLEPPPVTNANISVANMEIRQKATPLTFWERTTL